MAQAQTVDLARIIDAQKISAFHIILVLVCFLVVMSDGYDIGAAAFAAPVLIREWHVSPAALGGLFSAGLVAGLIGPPVMGWIADHYGRRTAIIGGLLFFGVFTWASVLSQDLNQLIWLRFIAGIGISGVLAIATALVIEYAPRRIRATLFVVMFSGVTFGGGVPGLVAKAYIETQGWQILFWVGGLAPIAVAIIAMFTLPESIKFLSLKRERYPQLVAQIDRLQPGLHLDPNGTYTIGDEVNKEKFSYGAIFKGRLAWITPMFWLSNAVNLMIFYFINQWTPTILANAGYPVGDAVLAATAFQFAGTLGGLVIMRPLDKFGFIPVPVLFACAIPIVALIGLPGLPEPAIMVLVAASGFCLLGLQFGNISCETNVYPTYIRSWGVGSCFGAGRVGSVVGPIVGGWLITLHVPTQYLFWIAAVPLIVGLINAAILTPLYRNEVKGAVGSLALQPAAGED
ncbi:MAG TPA: MFS transporter [Stellaceae bacterium]|nr:MFS transporter [Stellaceae bacterium]